MTNLAVLCPNQRDATSLYRGIGPFAALRRQRKDLRLVMLPNNIDWSILAMLDGLFVQRPYRPDHVSIMKMAARQGLPMWVDLDDDLFCVPDWNPASSLYGDQKTRENIIECMRLATVVSVSTECLKNRIEPLNPNTFVVPNAHNDTLLEWPERDQSPKSMRLILWRGSATHRADLNLAADACIDLSAKYTNTMWIFLGDAPWFTDYMPSDRVRCVPALDPFEYFDFIRGLKPDIQIIPLADHPFNYAKSNCAWLEATYAGAAVLAPMTDEWLQPGIVCYDRTPSQFRHMLEHMLKKTDTELREHAQKSAEYIKDNLMLTKVNETRLEILEALGL